MEATKPKAVKCYPAYGSAITPFPQELSPKVSMEKSKVYLYNPFQAGQRFLPKSPNAITLLDLKSNFIVDEPGNSDIGITDLDAQAMFKSQSQSWENMLDYVANQLSTEIALEPKKRGKNFKMTPEDIKMIISKPNQTLKPKGPSPSKLAPPKPR